MAPRAQFTASPFRSVAPVVCAVCGSDAHCIRRVPDSQGRRIEYRAFECAVCHRRSYVNAALAPNDNDIEKEVERLIRLTNTHPHPEP